MGIRCLVLGAGQEVGKSCVVVTVGNKKIMFDCGMHMGFQDQRRYPEFSKISKTGDFTDAITCIIITHFHLDHIGALPYFTEVCGYEGPIYMTTRPLHMYVGQPYECNFSVIAQCLTRPRGESPCGACGWFQQVVCLDACVDCAGGLLAGNQYAVGLLRIVIEFSVGYY
eukprot:Gb_11668 [translate_table: standard]